VAKILDVHRSTAMRWMKAGILPGFELLPGEWRVYEEALMKFVKERERKGRTTQLNKHASGEEFKKESPAVQASGNHG